MLEELKKYIKDNLIEEDYLLEEACVPQVETRKEKKNFFTKYKATSESVMGSMPVGKVYEDDYDLKNWIKDNNDYSDFQTTLFKMIDDRHLVDADVYNKVHIDRRLFSKIRNDKNYHPSKETIILLGLSLELSEEEIEKLLDSASYSLPRNNHYDLIIRFCFMKGIYKIKDVNEMLEEYNCKLFSY